MTFSAALELLKAGEAVARTHWGIDYILIQEPDEESLMTEPYIYGVTDTTVLPWTPQQADLFAEDWEIIDLASETE